MYYLFSTSLIAGLPVENIVFKRVFAGDLKEEAELFIRSFLYAHRDVPKTILQTANAKKRLRLFFAQEPADLNNPQKEIYVIRAEYENTLAGFVSFEKYNIPEIIYIRELAIDPSVMKCGLGKKLVFICKEYVPTIKKIVLATANYNENAIGFYKHLGFTQCADIPHGWDPNLFIGLEYTC